MFRNLFLYVCLKIWCYFTNKFTIAQSRLKNRFYELDYTMIFKPEMGEVVDAQCRLSMENVKPGIKDFA